MPIRGTSYSLKFGTLTVWRSSSPATQVAIDKLTEEYVLLSTVREVGTLCRSMTGNCAALAADGAGKSIPADARGTR